MNRKKQFLIPAVEALGRDVVEKILSHSGYVNPERTLACWVQRRQVPAGAREIMRKEAERQEMPPLRTSDFDVIPVTRLELAL